MDSNAEKICISDMEKTELSENFSQKTTPLVIAIFNLIVQLTTFICFCVGTAITLPNIKLEYLHIAKCFFNMSITFTICMIILSVILIIGVVQMRPKLILLYLGVGLTRIAMFLPICVVLITMACVATESKVNILWTFLRFVFYSAIDFYVLANMYFHRLDIQDGTFQELA